MEFYTFLVIAGVLAIAAIAVIGGVIELLRQRVLVDSETRAVIGISIPGLGDFSTNYPSLGAIALGLLMCFGTIVWISNEPAQIPVTATVTVTNPALHADSESDLFLSVVPQRYRRSVIGNQLDTPVRIGLSVDDGEDYVAIVRSSVKDAEDGVAYQGLASGPINISNSDGTVSGEYESVLRVR